MAQCLKRYEASELWAFRRMVKWSKKSPNSLVEMTKNNQTLNIKSTIIKSPYVKEMYYV